MLVERRAIEPCQTVLILGKVTGYPVEDDANAGTMARIDEILEVFGGAESTGRSKEPDHLIAPGARERMLHHGEQFDVRESEFTHVRHERVGKLAVRQRSPVAVTSPTAEMHFVDRHRRSNPHLVGRPCRHPLRVAPLVVVIPDDRRRQWRGFEVAAARVRFEKCLVVGRHDLELVAITDPKVGQEDLPETGQHNRSHRVHAPVPPVEIADDAHASRVGRPHGEMHTRSNPVDHRPRTQPIERAHVSALGEQMLIEGRQHRAISIGIVNLGLRPIGPGQLQPVVEPLTRRARHEPFEDTFRMHTPHRDRSAIAQAADSDCARLRSKNANDDPALVIERTLVRTKHRKGIGMQAACEKLSGRRRKGRGLDSHLSELSAERLGTLEPWNPSGTFRWK